MFSTILFSKSIHISKEYLCRTSLFFSNICLLQKITDNCVKMESGIFIFGSFIQKLKKRGVSIRPLIIVNNFLESQDQFGKKRKHIVPKT